MGLQVDGISKIKETVVLLLPDTCCRFQYCLSRWNDHLESKNFWDRFYSILLTHPQILRSKNMVGVFPSPQGYTIAKISHKLII